jgi:hypothetical protein
MRNARTRTGLWLIRRYPGLAARLGWQAVKHPRRTATVVAVARQAPIVAHRARAAAQDPEVRRHAKIGSEALGKAAKRLRDSQPGDAVADEKLRKELRRAAASMALGYKAAAHPKKKRRRRLGRTVFALGMIGAGAYAGYRVVRERQNGPRPVDAGDYDRERDETLAASFPASDPPPGPAA